MVGSFINSLALENFIQNQNTDVILLCAGWQTSVSIEDAIYAGFLAEKLMKSGKFQYSTDAVSIALNIYHQAKENIFDYIMQNSPRMNSKRAMLEEDIRYCLTENQSSHIPILIDDHLQLVKQ